MFGRRIGNVWLGISATHFGASPFGREHPVDPSAGSIARPLPGGDLVFQPLAIIDAPTQALALENPDLDLGHVQPAGVLGGEVELQPPQEAMRLRGSKGLVERAGVCVERLSGTTRIRSASG